MIKLCENCGCEFEMEESSSYGTCPFCGTSMLIRVSGNKREQYLKKAEFFLEAQQFDLAYKEFEKVLNERSRDPEAYWGQFLCKYGIEYVKDPYTGEKKPTFHRNLPQSVLEAPSYQLALETADPTMKAEYEEQAKELRRIQLIIEEKSKKMDPFDIFISYKDSESILNKNAEYAGEDDNRTKDSYLAQDIYRMLTGLGYHVFYSRETLKDKVGEEYEPIIYSALTSAKLMLVIGSKKEYFLAPWVHNEWSRYLELRMKDKTKQILPIYADFEDLPDELGVILVSQNLTDQDFMTQLSAYVKATVKPSLGKNLAARKETAQDKKELDKKRKISDAFYRLEEKKYKEAQEIFQGLLKKGYKEYQVYQGLMLADNHVSNMEDLVNVMAIRAGKIQNNKWYQSAYAAANIDEKDALELLIKDIEEARIQIEQQLSKKEEYKNELSRIQYELDLLENFQERRDSVKNEEHGVFSSALSGAIKLASKKEQLDQVGDMVQPSWVDVIFHAFLLFLPQTVILLYCMAPFGLYIPLKADFLILGGALMIVHVVLTFLRRRGKNIFPVITIVWLLLFAVQINRKIVDNTIMFAVLEALAAGSFLAEFIRNKLLSGAIAKDKHARAAYKKEIAEYEAFFDEKILPFYREQIRNLSKTAAHAGMNSEERMKNEMDLMDRIDILKNRIVMKLSLN